MNGTKMDIACMMGSHEDRVNHLYSTKDDSKKESKKRQPVQMDITYDGIWMKQRKHKLQISKSENVVILSSEQLIDQCVKSSVIASKEKLSKEYLPNKSLSFIIPTLNGGESVFGRLMVQR